MLEKLQSIVNKPSRLCAGVMSGTSLDGLDIAICRIHGSGFLYHMVRNIIGTLANVGLGVLTPARFGEILEGRDRTKASATAPACGLYLEHVDYGEAFHF